METLEGTAADHETRILAVEADVTGTIFLFIVANMNYTTNYTFPLILKC